MYHSNEKQHTQQDLTLEEASKNGFDYKKVGKKRLLFSISFFLQFFIIILLFVFSNCLVLRKLFPIIPSDFRPVLLQIDVLVLGFILYFSFKTLERLNKRVGVVCPFCNQLIFGYFSSAITHTTGNCCCCGSKIFNPQIKNVCKSKNKAKQNPISVVDENITHPALDHPTRLFNKKHFQEAIGNFQKKEPLRILAMILAISFFSLALSWSISNFTMWAPQKVFFFNQTIVLVLTFLGIYSISRMTPKISCPHCNKNISNQLSSKIVLATGNCGHCGLPVFSSDNGNLIIRP